MRNSVKVLIGAGLLLLANTVIGLVRLKNNVSLGVAKPVLIPDVGGLGIKCNAVITNPTKDSIIITQPYVKILASGIELSSVQFSASTLNITPQSNISVPITLDKISWLQIAQLLNTFSKNADGTDRYDLSNPLQTAAYLLLNYQTELKKLNIEIEYSFYAMNVFINAKTPMF